MFGTPPDARVRLAHPERGPAKQAEVEGRHYSEEMDSADLDALRRAKLVLEQPSLAIRLADKVGVPLELLLDRLPAGAQEAIPRGTRRALDKSLEVALRTLDAADRGPTSDWLHRGVVVASGAFGGALGLPGSRSSSPSRSP